MKITEIDKNERERFLRSEDNKWCGFDLNIQQHGENKQCFYCNFALECGQQECIWRED